MDDDGYSIFRYNIHHLYQLLQTIQSRNYPEYYCHLTIADSFLYLQHNSSSSITTTNKLFPYYIKLNVLSKCKSVFWFASSNNNWQIHSAGIWVTYTPRGPSIRQTKGENIHIHRHNHKQTRVYTVTKILQRIASRIEYVVSRQNTANTYWYVDSERLNHIWW